jgi:hypothetical protein
MKMTHVCQNCISLEAQLIRSEEKRLKDKVAYQVKLASPKHKVKPGVEEDLIARVLSMGEWKEDKSGRLVLHKGGLEVLSNGGYEITPEVAVRDLAPVAPHFYDLQENTNTGEGPNPWAKEHWNMTKQGEIVLKDPAKAKRLAAVAGVALAI